MGPIRESEHQDDIFYPAKSPIILIITGFFSMFILINLLVNKYIFKVVNILMSGIIITMIVIGYLYKDECSMDARIPLWLIIEGVLNLVLVFTNILTWYFKETCCCFMGILNIFLSLIVVLWLILGKFKVFIQKSVIYINSNFTKEIYWFFR